MRFCAALLLLLSGSLAMGEPRRLGAKKELFLDDELIASASNVRRVIHPAKKFEGNPVLTDATLYGSVLKDGGRWRMWYFCPPGVCYSESADGIRWSQPGQQVLKRGGEFPYFYELFGVSVDPGERDPSRRFKMGYLNVEQNYAGPHEDPFHHGSRRGLGVAGSADGIHWKPLADWATEAICDGGTHWMYDSGRFLLYGRTKSIAPEVDRALGLHGLPTIPMTPERHDFVKQRFWGRAVALVESPDFLHWNVTGAAKAPVVMTADVAEDPPGSEIYALAVFPYETVKIGLVKVWHQTPDGGPLDLDLAVSRDSVHFTRVGDRGPFIPMGEVGEWDRFCHSAANNPPIEVGDELRFYYSGHADRHAPYSGKDTGPAALSGIGFASIKRDRFVSLAASFDGGVVTTRPLLLEGATLHLNAKSDFGEITVEALDPTGKNLLARSKPVRRDALDIAVEWDRQPPAAPVVLRFRLANAHLFAIWTN